MLEFVHRLLADAIATRRSYLLTGDEAFLVAHPRARETLSKALVHLGSLVGDNAIQTERLSGHLRPSVDNYFTFAAGIERPKDSTTPVLETELKQSDAKAAEVRALTAMMIDEEDHVLELRQEHADAA